jgi:L-ascorbate metabolism protein UlaG (beta-lactamase superfamily)
VSDHPSVPGAPSADCIRWGGHATVRIELGGTAVLTDPVLRDSVMHLRRVVPLIEGIAADLGAVVISHLHHDHLDLSSLRQLPAEVPLIIPGGARAALGRLARRTVVELAPGDETEVDGVRIRATPAAHRGGRPGLRTVRAPALGYLLERGGTCVYFAGDTDLFPQMAHLAPRIDCALLPVWGWGPTLGPGHLDPDSAAEALTLLRPRLAIPIHWGTFRPRGVRADRRGFLWTPGQRFAEAAARTAPDVAIHVIAPGESVAIALPAPAG